jgi:hypothetical protein
MTFKTQKTAHDLMAAEVAPQRSKTPIPTPSSGHGKTWGNNGTKDRCTRHSASGSICKILTLGPVQENKVEF